MCGCNDVQESWIKNKPVRLELASAYMEFLTKLGAVCAEVSSMAPAASAGQVCRHATVISLCAICKHQNRTILGN